MDASSIKVYVGTIENELDSDSYEIAFQEEDGCDFEVTFEKEYLDTIKETTTIIMTYNAILNEHATVNDPATNEAYLQYGEKSDVSTTPAETKTYIYDFELTKQMEKISHYPEQSLNCMIQKRELHQFSLLLIITHIVWLQMMKF